MIKKLKTEMLITIMFFVTIIIASLIIFTNYLPRRNSDRVAMDYLSKTIENKNSTELTPDKPPSQTNKTPPQDKPFPQNNMFFKSNLITVKLDEDNNITGWSSNRQDLYDDDYINEIADLILKKSGDFGRYNGYYYLHRVTPNGGTLILLDNSIAFQNEQNTLILTIILGIASWILFLLLSIFITNKMTKPISQTFEKQRQFISDAGHELKTPVAVISANAEVLESDIGENKWLDYIKNEATRMNKLIKNLMILAEVDDLSKKSIHRPFDLSKAVLGVALPFESLAFENKIVMHYEIEPDIPIIGNKERIEQLVSTLLSNAIKYSNERGIIKVSLSRHHKSVKLSVYNTGIGIKPEEKDKIFERFYRVDKDRSRKGGSYGLGLAIARSIADEHHAKIYVDSVYNEHTTFTVEFNGR